MRKPRVIAPPNRIFLCPGELDDDVEFDDLSEVSWCADKQEDTDVEYRLVKPRRHRPHATSNPDSKP